MTVYRKPFLLVQIFMILTGIFSIGLYAATDNAVVKRYALYMASDNGGSGSERLRYAGSDAEKLRETMIELGGIPEQNSMILVDASKEDLDNAFAGMAARIRNDERDSKHVEFLFYYSGHSDENALLIGNERYDYLSLKTAISEIPSDIHVVILDSCYSGNFIRTKGGSRKKPFLMDSSTIVQGHAYLSSSSANESSQESDTIGASYFTSAIITGLRGAADTSGDNRVSLNELYDYAFNNTLSQTELSEYGPQHPAYNITLVGSGDLVLTDISKSDSALLLTAPTYGKFIIRTNDGKLVSEVNKTAGTKMELALPAGEYVITCVGINSVKQSSVTLIMGSIYTLDTDGMKQVRMQNTTARGPRVDADIDPVFTPFCFSMFPGLQIPGDAQNVNVVVSPFMSLQKRINGVQANGFIGTITDDLRGVQASGFLNILAGPGNGVQASGFMNVARHGFDGIQATGFLNILTDQNIGFKTVDFDDNMQNRFKCVQVAGFVNSISGTFDGVQVAGFGNNISRSEQGLQVSGFFNNCDTGTLNIQISDFINVADKINGFQIGILNFANENNGLALGLLNFIGNGIMSPSVYREHSMWFTQYQGGTNSFFTTFLIGTPDDFAWDYYVYGFGIGTRAEKKPFSVDFEVLDKCVVTSNMIKSTDEIDDSNIWIENNYPSARITANFMLFKHLGAFIAYNADLKVSGWNESAFTYWDHGSSYSFTVEDTDCTIYSYCTFGLKF